MQVPESESTLKFWALCPLMSPCSTPIFLFYSKHFYSFISPVTSWGPVGLLPLFSIINIARISIHVQTMYKFCVKVFFFLLGMNSWIKLQFAGSDTNCMLNFLRNYHVLKVWLHHFVFLAAMYAIFKFCMSLNLSVCTFKWTWLNLKVYGIKWTYFTWLIL